MPGVAALCPLGPQRLSADFQNDSRPSYLLLQPGPEVSDEAQPSAWGFRIAYMAGCRTFAVLT
jgi:hypothetical protein